MEVMEELEEDLTQAYVVNVDWKIVLGWECAVPERGIFCTRMICSHSARMILLTTDKR